MLIAKGAALLQLQLRQAAGFHQLPGDQRRSHHAQEQQQAFGGVSQGLPADEQGFHNAELCPQFRMGLLKGFRCCSLGLQIRQKLVQPQIGPLRQPGAKENQRQGEIPHLRAEPIGGLFLCLEAVCAALSGLQS